MAKRDYYEILGIAKNATAEDIKKAYRKLAMKYHPDRNPNSKQAEENFKEAKEAYEILHENDKRQLYDRYGHAGVDPNASMGSGMGGAEMGGFADAFGDIFGEIFGGAAGSSGRRSGPQVYRGSDLKYSLEITLEQAAHGFDTEIRVPNWESCDICHGSGAKLGTIPKTCSTCGGHGTVRMRQGVFSVQQNCPTCHGTGKEVTDPCAACESIGRVRKNKTLEVKIPAGIDEGMRIRSPGNGEPGLNGGLSGDLYIETHLKPHNIFQRDGDDLHCELTIPFTAAALGGELQVPTLNGKYEISIPEGTQSGKTFRLRGRGIKGVRASYPGDLHCHVVVETPVKLTDIQKELLRKFETSLSDGGERHSPQSKSWTDRVKSFFN